MSAPAILATAAALDAVVLAAKKAAPTPEAAFTALEPSLQKAADVIDALNARQPCSVQASLPTGSEVLIAASKVPAVSTNLLPTATSVATSVVQAIAALEATLPPSAPRSTAGADALLTTLRTAAASSLPLITAATAAAPSLPQLGAAIENYASAAKAAVELIPATECSTTSTARVASGRERLGATVPITLTAALDFLDERSRELLRSLPPRYQEVTETVNSVQRLVRLQLSPEREREARRLRRRLRRLARKLPTPGQALHYLRRNFRERGFSDSDTSDDDDNYRRKGDNSASESEEPDEYPAICGCK